MLFYDPAGCKKGRQANLSSKDTGIFKVRRNDTDGQAIELANRHADELFDFNVPMASFRHS